MSQEIDQQDLEDPEEREDALDPAWQPKPNQRVVCAANRFPCGTIVLGARHYDMLMHKTIEALGIGRAIAEQGFVDQWGDYLTRQQAWRVAQVAGQIRKTLPSNDSKGGTLYSENLY